MVEQQPHLPAGHAAGAHHQQHRSPNISRFEIAPGDPLRRLDDAKGLDKKKTGSWLPSSVTPMKTMTTQQRIIACVLIVSVWLFAFLFLAQLSLLNDKLMLGNQRQHSFHLHGRNRGAGGDEEDDEERAAAHALMQQIFGGGEHEQVSSSGDPELDAMMRQMSMAPLLASGAAGEDEMMEHLGGPRRVRVVVRFSSGGSGSMKLRGAPGAHPLDGLDDGIRQLLEGSAARVTGSLLPHVDELHGDEEHKEIKASEGGSQIIRVTRMTPMIGGDPLSQMLESLGAGGRSEGGDSSHGDDGLHENGDVVEHQPTVRVIRISNQQEAMDSFFPMMMLSQVMSSGVLDHIMSDLIAKDQHPSAPDEFKDPVTNALLDDPAYIYWPKKDTLWKERAFESRQIQHWFKDLEKDTNPANDKPMDGNYELVPAVELKARISEWKREQEEKHDEKQDEQKEKDEGKDNRDADLKYDVDGNLVPTRKIDAETGELVPTSEEDLDVDFALTAECGLTGALLSELHNPVTRDGIHFYEGLSLDEALRHELRDPVTQVFAVRSEYISANELVLDFGSSADPKRNTVLNAVRALHLAGQRFNEKTLSYHDFKARAVRIFTNGKAKWSPPQKASWENKRVLVLSSDDDANAQEALREQFVRKGFEHVDVKNFKTPEEFAKHADFHKEGYDAMYDLGVLPKAHRKDTESIAGVWSKVKSLFADESSEFITHNALDAEDLEAAHKLACRDKKKVKEDEASGTSTSSTFSEKDDKSPDECRSLQILSVRKMNGVTQTRWVPKPKRTDL
mmetsp:Transcript_586/g.1220  ORF Transcript_586/g.1220 Transcript_586/m.1220 type:complete len:790 (-) Transcript_586:1037-3406(-)